MAATNARKSADDACGLLAAFMYQKDHPPSPIVMLQPQANGIAGRIGSQVAGQPDPSTMHQQQLQAMLHGAQMAVSNLVAMAEEIKKLVNGDEPNAAETLES